MDLDALNGLDRDSATRQFLRCCGSATWATGMADARPFDDVEAMSRTADAVWSALGRTEWLEAFAAHPRIGRTAPATGGRDWSSQEQARAGDAAEDVRERLASANREYEARFGYIFIACATGRSAAELLAALEARLQNDSETELCIAADEQRKITCLRLVKLLQDGQETRP